MIEQIIFLPKTIKYVYRLLLIAQQQENRKKPQASNRLHLVLPKREAELISLLKISVTN